MRNWFKSSLRKMCAFPQILPELWSTVLHDAEIGCIHGTNKPGTAKVKAQLEFQNKQSVLNMGSANII